MKRSIRNLLGPALAVGLSAFGFVACSEREAGGGHDEHAEAGGAEAFERGPHRGRWLEDGDFALELTIFEDGVPPEFRAFVYQGGEPRDPAGVTLEVTLTRLGDRTDRIAFTQKGEYLLGDREVYEPHSFEVAVVARTSGRSTASRTARMRIASP